MGKASTNKKVARAAGIGGGRTYRRNTPWGYFGIIALILVLGVVGTWSSRDRRLAQISQAGTTQAPAVGTVWNEGYAVYACGTFLKPITSSAKGQGIYTSQPGIIHIDPTVDDAAGKNATLGKFASTVGMTLNAAELKVPGGKLYQDGNKCEGQPGHVYVKQYGFPGATTGQVFNGNTKKCKANVTNSISCGQLARLDPRNVLLESQNMLVIAFVPQSDEAKIPPPPSSVVTSLEALGATASTTTTTTTPVPTT